PSSSCFAPPLALPSFPTRRSSDLGAVHRHAVAASDEADDVVTGNRRTTLGQPGPHIGVTLHGHTRVAGAGMARVSDLGGHRLFGDVLLVALQPAQGVHEFGDDALRTDLVFADGRVERVHVVVAQITGQGHDSFPTEQALDRKLLLTHDLRDLFLALFDRGLAAFLGETVTDLVACPGALDEIEPVPAGPRGGVLGGEDLHRLTVVQFTFQRHQATIDARTDGAMTDLCVYGIGEVDGGSPLGERDHVTLRGEDEDLLYRQVETQRLEELARVLGLLLPVDELAQPLHIGGALGLGFPAVGAVLLVLPVRGDAVLG